MVLICPSYKGQSMSDTIWYPIAEGERKVTHDGQLLIHSMYIPIVRTLSYRLEPIDILGQIPVVACVSVSIHEERRDDGVST